MKQVITILFLGIVTFSYNARSQSPDLIYVDEKGVMRWTKDKKEASFFGVNYTVPFAYGYRSHKAIGKDIKQAIDEDVYHFSRLGFDAFRVHMWDVEISDSLGNLLQNEHLDLFDYLLFKLRERNIYSLITPIAFWGNGYPERDEKTPGFATVYGKGQSVVKEEAIKAQENYLRQLMNHINPYTKTTYKDDWSVIAAEINNEPHHSGPKEKTTEYVNRLTAAVRSSGWKKPIFYNISESPWYADAIAKSNVQGHSFQWYPSGLVANRTQKGNFLPHVDRYTIPFDSVPEYRNKARMVYEFDAADILESYMYPAMARSYRTAGFQWATQFAYDPMATSYANTEYQTHYVNLAYTPSKAISLLIAAKVFHKVPRLKSYGSYPVDTLFDVFRVSYKNGLSEMNSEEEFYYSNSTTTQPKNISKLKHVAGVGSSAIVQYQGNGAYFLDMIQPGVWRLEVMPDAIQIRDPFERASPKKENVRIEWKLYKMQLSLPDLGTDFIVSRINQAAREGEWVRDKNEFNIYPGTYLITSRETPYDFRKVNNQFVAPHSYSTDEEIYHIPFSEVSAGKPFFIKANMAGFDSTYKISVELRSVPRWRTIQMKSVGSGEFYAEIPAEAVMPGILTYRILVQKSSNDYTVYPGNHRGNPFAWDNTNNETFQTIVANDYSGLEIFNTNPDRSSIIQYNPDWRNNSIRFVPSDRTTQLALKIQAKALTENQVIGFQFFIGDKTKGRASELSSFKNMVLKVRSEDTSFARLTLIDNNGFSFSAEVVAGAEWTEIKIPFSQFKADSMLLLPRPYPGFLPLWFKAKGNAELKIEDVISFQFIISGKGRTRTSAGGRPANYEIASAWLEK